MYNNNKSSSNSGSSSNNKSGTQEPPLAGRLLLKKNLKPLSLNLNTLEFKLTFKFKLEAGEPPRAYARRPAA